MDGESGSECTSGRSPLHVAALVLMSLVPVMLMSLVPVSYMALSPYSSSYRLDLKTQCKTLRSIMVTVAGCRQHFWLHDEGLAWGYCCSEDHVGGWQIAAHIGCALQPLMYMALTRTQMPQRLHGFAGGVML